MTDRCAMLLGGSRWGKPESAFFIGEIERRRTTLQKRLAILTDGTAPLLPGTKDSSYMPRKRISAIGASFPQPNARAPPATHLANGPKDFLHFPPIADILFPAICLGKEY